ncbi:MAG: hypothetical protein ACE5GS_07770 [Kiloniellaceae bacterium]
MSRVFCQLAGAAGVHGGPGARAVCVLGLLAAALTAAPAATRGAAQEVRLTLAHPAAETSHAHMRFLKPWAQRLPILSGGRLRVAIEPGAGPVADLAARLAAGGIDLAWLPAAAVLGPGARVEAFELPFMAWPAEAASQAAMAFLDRNGAPKAADVRVILLHVGAPAVLHTRAPPVRRIEDLRGRRLYAPTRALRAFLREAGAEPVGPAVGEDIAALLAQGRLDGAVMSFAEAAPAGVIDAARFHTLAGRPPGGATARRPELGAVVYALVANARRYDALPEDLRRVMADSAGAALAEATGRSWDKFDQLNRRNARTSGHVFYRLPAAERRRWRQAGAAVIREWIAAADATGLDGAALVREARELIARYHALMDDRIEARTRPGRGKGG